MRPAGGNDCHQRRGAGGKRNRNRTTPAFTLPESLFTDPDGDSLTYSVTLSDGSPLPAWLSFDSATRVLSGTPENADVGNLNLQVTATDPEGLSASQTFTLTVENANDAPEATGSLPAQSAREGEPFTLVLPESLFSDPDGDALTFHVTLSDGSPLPAWLAFDPATRTLSGAPENGDAGNLVLKVTASDGSLTASLAFSLVTAASHVYNDIVGTSSGNTLSGTANDDHIQGLAGNDTLHGRAGNDLLDGGEGDDVLHGEAGDDALRGGNGNGNDTLNGDAGNDILEGNAGDDRLNGDAGDDILFGGTGNDRLEGNAGNDTYVFRKGDGEDIVNNYDAASAAIDAIRFEDAARDELTGVFRDGGDLILTYGTNDKLTIDNFYLSASYQIDRFIFTDGTLSAAEFFARYPVRLSSGTDILTFTAMDETVDGLAGNDTLYGGAGNDALYGNLGNDTLHGGDGNDLLDGGEGDDVLHGEAGDDALRGGNGNDTLNGDAGNDILEGNAGDDRLNGDAGDDILIGGTGNDRLEGGKGDDEYRFGRGDGQDVIYDYDTTKGNSDILAFGGDIAADQLWFRKSGGNLEISVLGGTDKVTINNWFSGSSGAYRVETILAGNGRLESGKVDALAEAMKAYSPPTGDNIEDTALLEIIGGNWEFDGGA
jgi:Ca2+-binding RTX toxin-like protein